MIVYVIIVINILFVLQKSNNRRACIQKKKNQMYTQLYVCVAMRIGMRIYRYSFIFYDEKIPINYTIGRLLQVQRFSKSFYAIIFQCARVINIFNAFQKLLMEN